MPWGENKKCFVKLNLNSTYKQIYPIVLTNLILEVMAGTLHDCVPPTVGVWAFGWCSTWAVYVCVRIRLDSVNVTGCL